MTPIVSPEVCTSVDSCLGHDTEAGAGPEPEAELQAEMSADGGFCLSAEEVQRHKDEIEDPAAESSTHEQLAAKDAEIAENHREIAELRRQRADRTE